MPPPSKGEGSIFYAECFFRRNFLRRITFPLRSHPYICPKIRTTPPFCTSRPCFGPILRTRRDALQLWGRARLAVSILPFYKMWVTRKEVMTILKRCDSTMTKWARRGYLVPSMVGGKHLYRKADVMRILNGGRK